MKKLIYIGKDKYGEEYYINLKDRNLTGWSFIGLRPETEDNLRRYAREVDIEEFCNIPDFLEKYIDRDSFADDMEEDWLERHDSQGEYEIDGETYYLGFGAGTDLFNYFSNHKIKTYEDLKESFSEGINITEEQFKELLKIMKKYKQNETEGYKLFMRWQENVSEFPDYVDEVK